MSAAKAVEMNGVCAGYGGGEQVLHDVHLHVDPGRMLSVLGPSGSGKTTLLRVVAGLHPLAGGTLSIDGRVVAGERRTVPPEQRRIGLVPQEAALFPHRTVAANIAFGLRARAGRAARDERVRELLDLVNLPGYGDRYPDQLSGGQRQRVALARALAPGPKLVLLDEAFGALDASLRSQLRSEVREILRDTGTASILVTHDQDEALSISDEIAVMKDGRVTQVGTPEEVYRRPADPWTAHFLGECSVLGGRCDGSTVTCDLGTYSCDAPAGPVEVLLRPEQLTMGRFGVPAEVLRREYLGHSTRYRVRPATGPDVVVDVPGAGEAGVGSTVHLTVTGSVHVIPGQPR